MSDVLTKIEIITRPINFEQFKTELAKIGVSGITVSDVKGTGLQKGYMKRIVALNVKFHYMIELKLKLLFVKFQFRTLLM